MTSTYPKRLIEVDLPIARISAESRREKSIRHGHISTLHIWWARRPLAACRAVACAALWPDPVDLGEWAARGDEFALGQSIVRPQRFLMAAREAMTDWAQHHLAKAGPDSYPSLVAAQRDPARLGDFTELRSVLLDFIADFAQWANSTDSDYLATSRLLTQAAYEALGGEVGGWPLVADPFAGGGSIPLEAARVGAQAFASDLNPIAVLLNELIFAGPYDRVGRVAWDRACCEVLERLEREPRHSYPCGPGAPSVFFWARTVRCEGPACGIEYPLLRGTLLSQRANARLAFVRGDGGEVQLESAGSSETMRPAMIVKVGHGAPEPPTCSAGKAVCPACGHVMKQSALATQAQQRGLGHRLTAMGHLAGRGKEYRSPTLDEEARHQPKGPHQTKLSARLALPINSARPSPAARGMSAVTRYGYSQWADLFFPRQLEFLEAMQTAVCCATEGLDEGHRRQVQLLMTAAVDRVASFTNEFCRWAPKGEHPVPPFGKNGFPMVWDFAEANPMSGSTGSVASAFDWVSRVATHLEGSSPLNGVVQQGSAQSQILPDDSVDAVFTDPPYYDSYPYADLADFFYPITATTLEKFESSDAALFSTQLSPKDDELVVQPSRTVDGVAKDTHAYQLGMTAALAAARAAVKPSGICVIVFANKETEGWEALLESVVASGWTVTSSWPIQTERESRSRGEARLQSSVHLVCRPRENADGTIRDDTGEWREILAALPRRIHEWMPRLADEGVVGADAIFACLGPALEVFSRYSRVEKASGERVGLREYLEQVWAAVSREALSMIFDDPETAGLEPDARLTAMWLWTLGDSASSSSAVSLGDDEAAAEGDGQSARPSSKTSGYILEFDAARKIAQGLGIHLEKAPSVVEVKGDKARLLPVAERTRYLFGKDAESGQPVKRQGKSAQLDLFAELHTAESGVPGAAPELAAPEAGKTALDRVHQAMILFAAGRGEALRRFLVEDGIGKQANLWKLAQALSALYPTGSDEKRWVDGVLARKKGLGL